MAVKGSSFNTSHPPCAGPAWLAWLIGEPLFRMIGRRGVPLDLDRAQNVLLVRLDNIGDMVLTTPMLRQLRKAMPGAWITLVVKPAIEPLLARCPYVDQVLPYEGGAPGRWRGPCLMWRAMRFARQHLAERDYDLAIVPRYDADLTDDALLAYFSGARHRIGYACRCASLRQKISRGCDRLLSRTIRAADVRHEVRHNLGVLSELGMNVKHDHLELWLDTHDMDKADEILRDRGDGPLVALGIGASHPRKQWPLDHFVELAEWLIAEHHATIVAVGGPDEKFLGLELHTKLDGRIINAVGRTTLRQAAAVLSRCDAYVGNDAGPMHLAAAGGTPCVQISCHPADGAAAHPQSPERFHPWDVGYRTIQPRTAIAPCAESCHDERAHCILALSPELVRVAFDDLMTKRMDAAERRALTATNPWPTISIIVPNFNGGATLERTLRSLVDQQYPALEIIVVDSGSTDDSLDIIKRYESHIAWWCSETRRGPSQAINTGFRHATGTIVNWLCSDDELLAGALRVVGEQFARSPQVDVLVGRTQIVFEDDPDRHHIDNPTVGKIRLLPINGAFSQPSCFYRRGLLATRATPLVESYREAMDLELWAYFKFRGVRWRVVRDVLGVCHQSAENASSVGDAKVTYEFERVYRRYCHERIPLTMWHRWLRYPLERFRDRHRGVVGFVVARPLQLALVLLLGPFYGFRRVRAMNWTTPQ
jgi:heptosyltransferase-2